MVKGEGAKPDCTIIMKDADFLSLAGGKLNGQTAFMQGKWTLDLKNEGKM